MTMAIPPSDTHILPPLGEQELADSLTSRDAAMLRCLKLAETVAPASVPVMVTGEVGAGKSLLARFIHAKSPFRDRPCLSLSCPNLGADEVKSRLLGGTAGAAAIRPGGILTGAAGGSIVLDGVSTMSGQGQRELLNILRGGHNSGADRVRIMSTVCMGRDSGNTFLEELVHILAESVIRIPPLRERREDIEALAARALRAANRSLGKNVKTFSQGAQDFLLNYDYPGNVRELFIIVNQAVLQSRRDTLFVEDFGPVTEVAPATADGAAAPAALLSLAEVEKRHINTVLLRTGWKKSAAARVLQITETMLGRKMKLYKLEREGE